MLISLLFLSIILVFSFRELLAGLSFAGANNRFLQSIHESASIFYASAAGIKVFTFDNLISNYGYFIFVYPIVLIYIIIKVNRILLQNYSILVVSGLILFIYMIFQRRYASDFSIGYALILSFFFYSINYFWIISNCHIIIKPIVNRF